MNKKTNISLRVCGARGVFTESKYYLVITLNSLLARKQSDSELTIKPHSEQCVGKIFKTTNI